jgi:formylglycine-generating enzyme required for sulfatase activity
MFYFLFLFILSASSLESDEQPPIGTVKVAGYYVDKFEMFNISWREFLHHNPTGFQEYSYSELLPDTSNLFWRRADWQYKPLSMISFEQANLYCKWRSEVVSEKIGRKVKYRLPSIKEWYEIAEYVCSNRKKRTKREHRETVKIRKNNPEEYWMYRAGEENLNQNRLFNLFDNVSEMTSEKGIAVGGNNLDLIDIDQNLTRVFRYKEPHEYLGFRCIAEYVDN